MSAYDLARFLLRPPLRRGLRWRVEGLEHIPAAGPALVAANHVSLADAPVVGYLVDRREREARFLAMAGLFRYPVLGGLLRRMGQIPVERATSRAADSLASAAAVLDAGEVVVIFPEGELSADLEPGRGRTGVARLARAAGVPVVPVGLWGTHRLHAKGHAPRWRPGLVVAASVGRPVPGPAATEDDRAAADRIMAAIGGQVTAARLLYGRDPPAGEESWWDRHRTREATCDTG